MNPFAVAAMSSGACCWNRFLILSYFFTFFLYMPHLAPYMEVVDARRAPEAVRFPAIAGVLPAPERIPARRDRGGKCKKTLWVDRSVLICAGTENGGILRFVGIA